MSHFVVMVIGDDYEKQLQPYHEFECTGIDDEYVIDIDKTEQHAQDYENGTRRMIRLNDGTLTCPYGDAFKVPDPDDPIGFRSKWEYPKDSEEVEIPFKEIYPTLRDFVVQWHSVDDDPNGKYSRIVDDPDSPHGIKVIDRTNPNAKWDWWVVGGRWTGYFKLKADAEGHLGRPGLMTKEAETGTADILTKGAIDFEAMKLDAAKEANDKFTAFEKATDGLEIPPTWEQIREKHDGNIDAAREEFNGYAWVRALRELSPWLSDLHNYFCVDQGGREIFVKRAVDQVGVPFAVVKDGKWYEKGSMGWWGFVSDEKEPYRWFEEFHKMFDELPDDTRITMVDCHI